MKWLRRLTVSVVAILLLGPVFLSFRFGMESVPQAQLPAFARTNPGVEEAYGYAVRYDEAFTKVPCYCACNWLGHTGLRSCHIKSAKGGEVVFSDHAVG